MITDQDGIKIGTVLQYHHENGSTYTCQVYKIVNADTATYVHTKLLYAGGHSYGDLRPGRDWYNTLSNITAAKEWEVIE